MKRVKGVACVLALTGVVGLTDACGEAGGKAAANHATAANNDFGLDLYAALSRENPGANLFFSPYSMASALAMAAEGAWGETAAEMGKVLRYPEAVRNAGKDPKLPPWKMSMIHADMAALNKRLQTKLEHPCELRVANALYGEKTYPFRPGFVDTLGQYYRTGAVVPVDFIHEFEAARLQINGWVEKQTKQRIKDLLAQGSLSKLTRLVLVNAIYFKGEWAEPFEENATKQEDFLAGAGRKIGVPMMFKYGLENGRYGAFNADGSRFATPQRVSATKAPDLATLYPGKGGWLVAELPYKGNELSMVVVVPQDVDGLGAVEKRLTSAGLQAWLDKLEGRAMHAQMPKFRLETDYQGMKETLQAMGMKLAFDEGAANFDAMCASGKAGLFISKVAHKAFVEMTEKGTEAAAATAVAAECAADGPAEPETTVPFIPIVRADRPYLFAIREVRTGTLLFLGRMVEPDGGGK